MDNIKEHGGMTFEIQELMLKDNIENNMSQQKIAEKYGTSRGTVIRCLKQMKEYVAEEVVNSEEVEKLVLETTGDAGVGELKPESKFTLIPNSIINISHNNEVFTADSTHPRFDIIIELSVAGDFDGAVELVDVGKAISKYSEGEVTIEGDTVLYLGQEVKGGLATKILELMKQGDEGFKKYVKFINNLRENPSARSVTELFGFIEHGDIEIAEDGCLLAWKFVKPNYKDDRTGCVENYIGNTISMPRYMVNDNQDQTCEQGLHICAWNYRFTSTAVRVKVHPKNVVSIPTDHKDQKMRCCEYEVMYAVNHRREKIPVKKAYQGNQIITVGEYGKILKVEEKE